MFEEGDPVINQVCIKSPMYIYIYNYNIYIIHVVNVIRHSHSSQCGVDNKRLMLAYILKSEEQTLYEYIVRVGTIMRYYIINQDD